MNKIMLLTIIILSVPLAWAVSIGGGVTPNINTEDFEPKVWMCDSRIVYDDYTEPGRVSSGGSHLVERINNYAFEGESISWEVLVMDKNGIQKIKDVFVSTGPYKEARRWIPYTYFDQQCLSDCAADYGICTAAAEQACFINGTTNQTCLANAIQACGSAKNSCDAGCERTGQRLDSNAIQANCVESSGSRSISPSCNARIDEEYITSFDASTMRYYTCTLTVETPDSMYGEQYVTVEAEDLDGLYTYADEVEYWFLNPAILLAIEGDLTFENVRPGTDTYSSTLLLGNSADEGSGVMLDMFISGTNFYDSTNSGAACPTSNVLPLSSFRYYAAHGYTTRSDARADAEGYVPIKYGVGFNDPVPFYGRNEVLQAQPVGPYFTANLLSPGAEMAITFKLSLPEPCNGDFDTGSIYFWGEAI